MTTSDLKRAAVITRAYPALRGLLLVPFGLYEVSVGLWRLAGSPTPSGGWSGWLVTFLGSGGGLALAATLALAIDNTYYRRAFGVVELAPQEEQRRRGFAILLAGVMLGAVTMDFAWRPPVSAQGLGFAVMLLLVWWMTGRIRFYYPILAALMVAVSIAPAVLGRGNLPYSTGGGQAALTLAEGGILLLAGLCDHLLLTREFARITRSVQP